MICNFATEEVFERDREGRLWAISGPGEAFWIDQLAFFDEVRIIARVKEVDAPENKVPVDDPRVSVFAMPHYRGPRQFVPRLPRLAAAAREAAALPGAFLLRVPGNIGTLMARALRKRGRRFAAQMVGDPRAVLRTLDISPVVKAMLMPTIRATERICREAMVITYVTGETLQRAYPPRPDAVCIPFSDIDLPEQWFGEIRTAPAGRPYRLLLCGSLEQLYKGPDVLIEALSLLHRDGHQVTAAIAGDGRYRPALEEQAARLDVADKVRFLGNLSRDEVARTLDASDIFVMPSRTEGLPRALLEALAKGVPSLGSRVGGIPELLDEPEMVPPGDAGALAAAVAALIGDPDRYRRLSQRGIAVARGYDREALAAKRARFYAAVRAMEDGA